MYSKKLKSMPYANCHLVYTNTLNDNNNVCFVSYTTPVIVVSDGWLRVRGLYSATTRKQIGRFMRELYGLSYQTAKTIFVNRYELNVNTCELREIQQQAMGK